MSDSTTSAYRIQHLTGEDNYPTWAIKMMDILTDLGLLEYVLGTNIKPVHTLNSAGAVVDPNGTKAAEIAAWEKKDRQALSQI